MVDDNFAESAQELIENFGEPATYFKRGGAPGRAITAIIQRDPPAKIPESGRTLAPKATLKVLDNATTGILNTEFENGDELQYPVVKGSATLIKRPIRLPTRAQGGMVHFDVT